MASKRPPRRAPLPEAQTSDFFVETTFSTVDCDFSNFFGPERSFPRTYAPDEEDLRDLVDLAVWTPLLAAHDALLVLADALLLRGKIKDVVESVPVEVSLGDGAPFAATMRAGVCVLGQALGWARAKHLPSMLYELKTSVTAIRDSVITLDGPAGGPIYRGDPFPTWLLPSPTSMAGVQANVARRERRGLGGTPLALRAHLKPWERR